MLLFKKMIGRGLVERERQGEREIGRDGGERNREKSRRGRE